jgi:hypothetical protein
MAELNKTEVDALYEALEDEYRAWATYDQVISDFGEVRPFINIRDAEARHIQALCSLLATYEITVPKNTWSGRVTRYKSLREACEAGVTAEIENDQMYTRLLRSTDKSDILTVFRNLQQASQQRHLPAFQRCVERQ